LSKNKIEKSMFYRQYLISQSECAELRECKKLWRLSCIHLKFGQWLYADDGLTITSNSDGSCVLLGNA